jgi:hypothetical protein
LAGPGRWLHCVDATLVAVARVPEVCHEVVRGKVRTPQGVWGFSGNQWYGNPGMKTSDVKQLWAGQSRSARLWTTIGLVGLFGFVAVGVFLGVESRQGRPGAPHDATGPVPPGGNVDANRLGPSPTPLVESPPSAGPSASASTGSGSGTSGGTSGSGTGGTAASAPDAPGSVTLVVVEHFNNDLAVTVHWTKPNDHGRAISRYDVVVHSAPDAPIPVSTTNTETTVTVPCGTSCGSRTVTATVQAVNAVGSSPQASGSFGGGLPADNMTCMFAGEAGVSESLECTLYDTNVSTVWTVKNSNAQLTYNNVSKVSALCPFTPQFDTLVVTVSASNGAGTTIRGVSYTCPV